MTGPPDVAPSRPRIWVACARVGGDSEPWLWRQLTSLPGLTTVVAGALENTDAYPLEGPTVVVEPAVRMREMGPGRWVDRARGTVSGNHFTLPPRVTRRLVRHARRQPPDVILCHFGHIALRLLPTARSLGVPLVAHFHGLDLSSGFDNRWYRWSLARSVSSLSRAIVVGAHQREVLEQLGMPADRIHVIPCGVPTSDFAPPTGAVPDDGRPTRFVTVVRLVPHKGVDLVLEAFAHLRRDGLAVQLDVVGDGPQRDDLEALARRLGVDDDVVFHGSCPQQEVRRILAESDVYVQHSIRHGGAVEGFGVSVAEGAAMSLPVVASATGGVREQVVHDRTGFLVEESDVAAMADRMRLLADDPQLRQRMGDAGRRHVVANFDTIGQVAKLHDVLTDVSRVSPSAA